MEKELGEGNKKPEILSKLAQYELTLLDWIELIRGQRNMLQSPVNAGLRSRRSLDLFRVM